MTKPAAAIPEPPSGWKRLAWVGPGFLWMVSAAGSGELLFTPRIGALYGYALLWALIAAVAMKWFINREIGRYAVCKGESVLRGFATLPGPRNWAVWVILLPQALVAVTAIAGLAGSAATALILVLPGDMRLWMAASLGLSTGLVFLGRYGVVEKVAALLAAALTVAALAAAFSVFPAAGELAQGLVPRFPPGLDFREVLPWLGFMLSGAAGMLWYSYWVPAKGYGAAGGSGKKRMDPADLPPRDRQRLRGWIRQMTLDNSVAVAGAFLVTFAFLILGSELLRPQGLVPEEDKVASVLGRLLGDVWGPVGFWFMVVGVFVGFWDTVLSDQDGHSRMFADGTRLLAKPHGAWMEEKRLRRVFLVVLMTALPMLLYLATGEPVGLLKVAGAVEACHIPLVTVLILVLNRRALPPDLRPSAATMGCTALAGLFFAGFAVFYLISLGQP